LKRPCDAHFASVFSCECPPSIEYIFWIVAKWIYIRDCSDDEFIKSSKSECTRSDDDDDDEEGVNVEEIYSTMLTILRE
jgi:hypothetical protein